MNVNLCASVRIGNFLIVNLGQPVVSGYRARVAQNKTADRISNGRVFFYAPVGRFYIAVYQFFVVYNRGLDIAEFFTIFTIQNVAFRNVVITRFA